MGLFDGFHSATAPGKGFVLLRSIAALSGGFWFALVWLPRSVVVRIVGWKKWFPFFVAAGSVHFPWFNGHTERLGYNITL
jgi:hypothetical protein